ncbi:MAG: DNA-binding domain-containing protein [Pseudomonadota bacterium]
MSGGQSAFAAALFDPAAPLPDDVAPVRDAAPVKRFNVYRNNVIASLIDALGRAYPTCKTLVGDPFFAAVADLFVRAHPPSSPLMMLYGAEFPDWIEGFEPAQSVPYLGDIARLERARRESYHAAEAPVVGPEALGAAAGAVGEAGLDRIRLRAHPALRLVRSRFPILSIWAASNGEGDSSEIRPEAQAVIVVRPDETLEMVPSPAGGATFVEAFVAGQTLGDATATASQEVPEFDLARNLGGLLAVGAIESIDYPCANGENGRE